MPLGTEAGRVLDVDPAPHPKRGTPPIFPCLLWPMCGPSQLLLSTCILFIYLMTKDWRSVTCQWYIKKLVHANTVEHSSLLYTLHINIHIGWRRINRTIQPFNQIYENLHKITSLVFVQPGAKFDSSYYCDVVLNQSLLPDMQKLSANKLTFQQDGAPAHHSRQTVAFLCIHVSELVENWPPNGADQSRVHYLFDLGSSPTAQQLVYRYRRTRDVEQISCKPAGSRLVKTLSIAL